MHSTLEAVEVAQKPSKLELLRTFHAPAAVCGTLGGLATFLHYARWREGTTLSLLPFHAHLLIKTHKTPRPGSCPFSSLFLLPNPLPERNPPFPDIIIPPSSTIVCTRRITHCTPHLGSGTVIAPRAL